MLQGQNVIERTGSFSKEIIFFTFQSLFLTYTDLFIIFYNKSENFSLAGYSTIQEVNILFISFILLKPILDSGWDYCIL